MGDLAFVQRLVKFVKKYETVCRGSVKLNGFRLDKIDLNIVWIKYLENYYINDISFYVDGYIVDESKIIWLYCLRLRRMQSVIFKIAINIEI